MADIVASHRAFTGQFANTRHGFILVLSEAEDGASTNIKGRRLAAPGISLAVLRGMRKSRQVGPCLKTGSLSEVRVFYVEPLRTIREVGGFAPLPRTRGIPPKVFFKQRRYQILTRQAFS
jgi:hypothetical protein